ncbi:response regulator transcription factor [Marinomonas sp. THO17]|uniref:response regulator transcription factor n=1 Tax=Marinomonas sp. THO17 TaxID=3149048 RepID=UPI00336C1EA5
MQLLVLEDDKEIRDWLLTSLTSAGHLVDGFAKGKEALIAATTREYQVLILDWMIPDLDGLSVLKALRSAKVKTPAIMLTALADIEDKVAGLNAGADDYLAKPFALSELLARVNALGRRVFVESDDVSQAMVLRHKDIELDLLSFQCQRAQQKILLNTKEVRLLEVFMRNPGRVMTKSMLLERVWNIDFNPSSSIVETHVSRLRAKIDKPFSTSLIETVRGAGYVFG